MSNMYIFLDERNDNVHLQNCCKLGSVLSKYKGNTFRKNCLDEGHMYIVGIRKLCNGSVTRYKLTESDEVKEALKNLVRCSEDYYRYIGLTKLIDSLKLKQKIKKDSTMSECFVSTVTSSFNYRNSAHVDVDDDLEGIVTWTKEGSCEVEGWYFLLPNVTVDGNKGIAITIKHGLTIQIDARRIRHCTTWKNLNGCKIYGTYFGCKK